MKNEVIVKDIFLHTDLGFARFMKKRVLGIRFGLNSLRESCLRISREVFDENQALMRSSLYRDPNCRI